MTTPDAWIICTALVCATILVMFFVINNNLNKDGTRK